jgi:2-hydroxy-3-keto-5-methylthiopentenyl-1-phosphate phosphatase
MRLGSLPSKLMANSLLTPSRATRLHWILDWDGTLTKRDTLDALVNIAQDFKPTSNVSDAWRRVTQAYISDYEETIKKLVPDGRMPQTLEAERKLLKQLEDVEWRSIKRLSASRIFEGLTADAVEAGAERAMGSGQVQLRTGVQDFLQLAQRLQNPDRTGAESVRIDVLSVNWSQRFIAGCLRAAAPNIKTRTPTSVHAKDKETQGKNDGSTEICIYSNELQGIERGGSSTGVVCADGDAKIISSSVKLAYLESLRGSALPVVYVGDSCTDLECIIAAELGICIRDNPMTSSQFKLKDALQRLGVECPHIRALDVADQRSVVWAEDFTEIAQWMTKSQK